MLPTYSATYHKQRLAGTMLGMFFVIHNLLIIRQIAKTRPVNDFTIPHMSVS